MITKEQAQEMLSEGNCLELQDLYAYSQGTLSGEARLRAEAHLVSCVLCREALECTDDVPQDLAQQFSQRIGAIVTKKAGIAGQNKILGNKLWIFAALGIVLTFIGLLMLLPGDESPVQTETTPLPSASPAMEEPAPAPSAAVVTDTTGEAWSEVRDEQDQKIAISEQTDKPAEKESSKNNGEAQISSTEKNKKTASREDARTKPDPNQPPREEVKEPNKPVFSLAVDIMRREHIEKQKKQKEEDKEGGKAYSALFNNTDEYDAEGMPQFQGGDAALNSYLKTNNPLPESVMNDQVTGSAIVSFTVSPEGNITDVVLMKTLEGDLDKQIVQSIREMPAWQAGNKKGKDGWAKYTVMFKVNKTQE
ncbi:MAG: energy transducer TonB [Flavobacteriales bacterium]|nr:energy transducer TonB [Flavobacteriales bacterium]MCB9447589.1 energy transducer TonB [Flavobacteriales bacterium]